MVVFLTSAVLFCPLIRFVIFDFIIYGSIFERRDKVPKTHKLPGFVRDMGLIQEPELRTYADPRNPATPQHLAICEFSGLCPYLPVMVNTVSKNQKSQI